MERIEKIKMKKYTITVEEIYHSTFQVEALTEEQAYEKAEILYDQQELCRQFFEYNFIDCEQKENF